MADSSPRLANTSSSAADQSDPWPVVINRAYSPCVFAPALPSEHDAAMTFRKVDRFCIMDIVCDAFEGRTHSSSGGQGDRSFSVQLVESGEKKLSSEGELVLAREGDVLINVGSQRSNVEFTERSHVLTALMPLERLQAWLPASSLRARYWLPAGSTAAQLLTANFSSISAAFLSGSLNNGRALTEAMIGLVAAVLRNEEDAATILRRSKLDEIKAYIAANLDDPDLTPGRIAAVKRISIRHLHALFEAEATTVRQHIISERLLRCRRDLNNPCLRDRTISELAYGAGFRSLTHFGRRFREAFGVTARQLRAGA